jgi:hypothetical protein
MLSIYAQHRQPKSIDIACISVYNVGMNDTQYTIRSVPPKVDQALRKHARKTGKSLNEVALEALAKGTGVTQEATFDDLDWFIGGQSLDAKSFDEAEQWLEDLPKDLE